MPAHPTTYLVALLTSHKFSCRMKAFLWFVVASLLLVGLDSDMATSDPVPAPVPAMFVFGDSLIDPGNNNNLLTLAKANYPPNGIDFPAGVTGRFCNGGTVADHLGYQIGLGMIPPFNNPSTKGSKLLQGVNFASGAAGILNDTGKFYGELFSMDEQIEEFGKKILPELRSEVMRSNGGGGETIAKDFVGKSLFFVCIGSNDYLNNYLLPFSVTRQMFTLPAFHNLLINEYTRQLKNLFTLGARKFLIAGLPPLGCTPNQIGYLGNNTSACVEPINEIMLQFNAKLKTMVRQLNTNLTEAYFLYWDIYTAARQIIDNPSHYGFKYPHTACCGAGRSKGQIVCLPAQLLLCSNRSEFVFWDPYHPTDALNVIIAKQAYEGNIQSTYPMNVLQLLQL